MLKKRYLSSVISDDLKEKMVFIGGPRQVGKTTFARSLGEQLFPQKTKYYSWDNQENWPTILKNAFPENGKLIILDEFHKYRLWKRHMKGLYDTYHERFTFLVTGSARLDVYRRGGDSLMGRYYYFRLHPFSVAELLSKPIPEFNPGHELSFDAPGAKAKLLFTELLKFGGFPEPFFGKNERRLRRWHTSRIERLVKEDIRDLSAVRDLTSLQLLAKLVPEKVGSLLSINALAEDLQTTYKTALLWVELFERFYYHFRIYPFSASTIKSLRKQAKLYLWDWSQVADQGARLENLVASHLLKFVHYLYDAEGYKAEVHFVRDFAGHEVDFLVTIDKKPWFLVEVKSSTEPPSPSLRYFTEKLKPKFSYQLTTESNVDLINDDIRIMSVDTFLSGLV